MTTGTAVHIPQKPSHFRSLTARGAAAAPDNLARPLEQVTASPQAQVAPHMPAENFVNVRPDSNQIRIRSIQNLYFPFHLINNRGFFDARYLTLKLLLHTVYMWPTESAGERTKRMDSWVLGLLSPVFQAGARSLIL